MRSLFAVVLSWTLIAPMAWAQSFRVGVELQPYLPYYSQQNGEYRGFARDLLDAFANAEGHQFTYVAVPVQRLLGDFLAGRLDLKYPDNPHWSAEQKRGHRLHYSVATAPFIDGVLVLPGNLGQGMGRLRVLGTPLGFTPQAYLAELAAGRMRLTQTNQIDSLLKMALSGRVDGVYLNPRVAQNALHAAGLPREALVFDATLPHLKGDYHLSSLQHPELIRQFDRFLASHPDLLAQLQARHGISP
ncbi:MAG: transporter substrate-binding domain-containing protein [Pseudomonas sp.]|uniref:substrate-binding periplasmic protein n=1 Tax=Pseudomonas sp. TaxID=306 RepID=UPI003393ACFD